jgi:hypothetical protein
VASDSGGASETLALVCHGDCSPGPVRGISVIPLRTTGGALAIRYRLEADAKRLRVPWPTAPRRVDGLWRHTCFEAFVARAGKEAYHEFNFSPSGEWASYSFRRYREGGSNLAGDFNPNIRVRVNSDRLELSAMIPQVFLPSGPAGVPLRIGLSAVTEDRDGSLSCWALRHPPGKPDFHHPDAFALEWEEES